MSEGYSENDYHRWLRINAFVRRMHQENYMYQLAEELDRLDEIDVIVDCMDEKNYWIEYGTKNKL